MNGKLIVIDGADGAGKATQSKLLADYLHDQGARVQTIDFPQYTQNHLGRLLRECMDGKRGDFVSIDPRIASVLYAADRFESSKTIRTWLESGHTVVLDRYVSSNMLHQGGKIYDEAELHDFLTWLDVMEHEVFAIPRPDMIAYLEVPYSFRQKMLFADRERTYLDTTEMNTDYQESAETNAKRLTAHYNSWHTIECVENNILLDKETIHKKVVSLIQPLLN